MRLRSSHRHRLLTGLSTLLLPALCLAGPVAGLLPLNETAEAMIAMQGKTVDDIRNEIPSMEAVGLPIYPESYFGGTMSGSGSLPGLFLATADPVAKVKDWYAGQEGLTWHDTWELFFVGDSYEIMQTESVSFMDISDDPSANLMGMMYDMKGMKTMITLMYEPQGQ